jgi:hypothetical protein
MKKKDIGEKPHFKKKTPGLARITCWVMVRPAVSTRFCRVVALAGFLIKLNQSNHQIDPPERSGFNNRGIKH